MAYLNQAAAALTAAMQKEKEGEFSGAIRGYRTAVDILITGVQGEGRRNANILVQCNRSRARSVAVVTEPAPANWPR